MKQQTDSNGCFLFYFSNLSQHSMKQQRR